LQTANSEPSEGRQGRRTLAGTSSMNTGADRHGRIRITAIGDQTSPVFITDAGTSIRKTRVRTRARFGADGIETRRQRAAQIDGLGLDVAPAQRSASSRSR